MAADTGSKKKRKKGPKDEPPGEAEANGSGEAKEATVEDLLARCQELEGKALRAHADYQNLRRRAQADLEAGIKRQMQPLLEELLFVLDFLDMALASPATTDETKNLAMGIEMTRNKFVQALEASDVVAIATEGRFDPTLHDAAEAVEDAEREPGTILETLRRGYKWRDQVLRPARVRVVAGDVKPSETADEEEGAPESADEENE